MKIIESEIGYTPDEILDQINSELGFSAVKTSEDHCYVILGNSIRLFIDFEEDVIVKIKFPEKEIDLSDSLVILETYSDAIESASEIVKLIRRMTSSVEDIVQ